MTAVKKPKAAHVFERDADNWYAEPVWCSARLFAVEPFAGRVVDPCAGGGNIVRSAREAGLDVLGFDLRKRMSGEFIRHGLDFFGDDYTPGTWPADNIVSNPPYGRGLSGEARLEEQFVTVALLRARSKVAVFLPTVWANGGERGRWLETLPLYREYRLSPRPSCPPGRTILAGEKPGGGTVDYSWFVFLRGFSGAPTLHFLRRDA